MLNTLPVVVIVMSKRIIITEEQLNRLFENPYNRTMGGLMKNRQGLCEELRMVPSYPMSDGQTLVSAGMMVDEGLTRTFPTIKTIEYVKGELQKTKHSPGRMDFYITDPGRRLGVDYDISDSLNVVIDSYIMSDEIHKTLERSFSLCGYYCSFVYREESTGDFVFQYEPKFQDSHLTKRSIGRYLYHITTVNHLDKIRKIGFIPKSRNKNFDYPPRVYFFT